MTPQEAIEIITNAVQGDGTKITAEQDEALAIVQRATKKRIPRMPKIIGSPADYNERCPNCNERVDIFADSRFCQQCGQALDWSQCVKSMPINWVFGKLYDINTEIHRYINICGRSSGRNLKKLTTFIDYGIALSNAMEIIKNSKPIITKEEGKTNDNQNQIRQPR